MKRIVQAALLLFAIVRASPAIGQEAKGFDEKVVPFVKNYCIDCHGPDTQKAGLRLDKLGSDLTDEAKLAKWIRVHDQVATGQMPPRKRNQPAKAEADTFTKHLREQLHTASLTRQETKGRVLLRRLNATEYENTIHELVGTKVRVK